MPVYYNETSGWVCIGDPTISAAGVKFMSNCIAFIDSKGALTSLWIELTN